MHMLNIQKCMFVLQLHCTLHSAAWESAVSRANSHTGTQLSSSQRPHSPQAQHSLIPAHQMLCSDWQCWKTPGISWLGSGCTRLWMQCPSPWGWLCWPGVTPGTRAGLELQPTGAEERGEVTWHSQGSWLGTFSSVDVPSHPLEH